jgi:hypothetical protein
MVVQADAEGCREDPSIARARATLVESERKLAKHLDGLEAGIPADVIASRIAAVQREKAAAETVLALAPSSPETLSIDGVAGVLSALHTVPDLLASIDQADRAALYKALGLTLTYRRVGGCEQVRLRASFNSVELRRVGDPTPERSPLFSRPRGVELERVEGGT